MSLLWIIVINQVKIKKKFLIFTTQKKCHSEGMRGTNDEESN